MFKLLVGTIIINLLQRLNQTKMIGGFLPGKFSFSKLILIFLQFAKTLSAYHRAIGRQTESHNFFQVFGQKPPSFHNQFLC